MVFTLFVQIILSVHICVVFVHIHMMKQFRETHCELYVNVCLLTVFLFFCFSAFTLESVCGSDRSPCSYITLFQPQQNTSVMIKTGS